MYVFIQKKKKKRRSNQNWLAYHASTHLSLNEYDLVCLLPHRKVEKARSGVELAGTLYY
jgi:hypothetical protein